MLAMVIITFTRKKSTRVDVAFPRRSIRPVTIATAVVLR